MSPKKQLPADFVRNLKKITAKRARRVIDHILTHGRVTTEELKQKYLTKLAAGEGGFSYCLSEPDAGSDAAAMRTRAVKDGDHWVLDGVKRWITNAGESEFYTVMAVTDPDQRARGISAFVVEKSDQGLSFGAPERKLGIKGSPTREVYLDHVRIRRDR